MNSPRTSRLLLVALLVLCFGLAAYLEPLFQAWPGSRTRSFDLLNTLLGDSRRMFANHFYVKADEYYHSGYYPTIFDNNDAFKTAHMAEDTGAVGSHNQGDEAGFLGPPRNWIDAFGRHFFPSRHTHLDEGGPADDLSGSDEVREILPWLKLSSSLDPENITTYTVTAFWLRVRMHRVADAEQVLREGLRNNPKSYELLFELGRLYAGEGDPVRARNVLELAARYWRELAPEEQADNKLIFEQIATNLAVLEDKAGNWSRAIEWFQAAQPYSGEPQNLQKRIDGVRQEMAEPPAGPSTPK